MREYINNIDCTGTSVTLALAGDFRFDLKFKGTGNGKVISILVDTKNYANAAGIFKSMDQIKAYFKQIKSFKELRIIQQGGRGIDLTKMKNAFQSALKKEPKAIFETNETLFKTIRFNDELIEDFEDFSNFVKSTEFTESDLASILKVTE